MPDTMYYDLLRDQVANLKNMIRWHEKKDVYDAQELDKLKETHTKALKLIKLQNKIISDIKKEA